MEAKDTVMSMKQLLEINNQMPPEAKYGDVFQFIAERQAEISFKTGIKEVLEAIHYEPNSNAFYTQPGELETKFKEWGISESPL